MKRATIRTRSGTTAVRIDDDVCTDLGVTDVGAVLHPPYWRVWAADATGAAHALPDVEYAPLVTAPGKIICQGLNNRGHIEESGLPVPTHPTLFSRFTSALIGDHDDVVVPPESDACDWEAEPALVLGKEGRRIPVERAADHIAGFAVMNDVSMRDWQTRTAQWLQGRTWEA